MSCAPRHTPNNGHTGGHGIDVVPTLCSQRGIVVVGDWWPSKHDDQIDLLQRWRIELLKFRSAFKKILFAELETTFDKGRCVVFSQGLRLGMAHYQGLFWHTWLLVYTLDCGTNGSRDSCQRPPEVARNAVTLLGWLFYTNHLLWLTRVRAATGISHAKCAGKMTVDT